MDSIWSSCIKVVQSVMEVDLPEDVSVRCVSETILTQRSTFQNGTPLIGQL